MELFLLPFLKHEPLRKTDKMVVNSNKIMMKNTLSYLASCSTQTKQTIRQKLKMIRTAMARVHGAPDELQEERVAGKGSVRLQENSQCHIQ